MNHQRISHFVFTLVAMLFMIATASCLSASAAKEVCSDLTGTYSENSQDYDMFANPIENYLVPTEKGWMRVVGGRETHVEYYTDDFKLTSKKTVAKELPIFGGFYQKGANYYLLTGRDNPEESRKREVFRVTKYDKNWKRLGAAKLSDVNTTIPFAEGSARFASCGDYLIIRTSHEMYQNKDGHNHQANITMELNCKTMQFTDSYSIVKNVSCGYVSHSFNQFIHVENNHIIAVDHGDARPRSVVLCKYKTDCSKGEFTGQYGFCNSYDLMSFAGQTGDNYTGASVGGFEVSSSSYLVAGSSEPSSGFNWGTRNIFLCVMNKKTERVSTKWITNYSQGSESASTPHLVAVGSDRFILLWTRDATVYYVVLDGTGTAVGKIYKMQGALSDCVPVVKNGEMIWYTNIGEEITFYRVKVKAPKTTSTLTVNIGHRLARQFIPSDGQASYVCEKCGLKEFGVIPSALDLYWGKKRNDTYLPVCDTNPKEAADLYYKALSTVVADEGNYTISVSSSDPNVVQIDVKNNRLQFLNAGIADVTFRLAQKPSVQKTVTFNVKHDMQQTEVKKATLSDDGEILSVCSLCGKSVSTVVARPETFSLSQTKFSSTGVQHKPDVTVIDCEGKILAKENYSLTYRNNVKIGKASVTITLRGNYSGEKTLAFKIVPMKVNGVVVKSNTKKQATISFNGQEGVQTYQIYFSTEKNGPYRKLGTTKTPRFTTTQLTSGITYYFKVRAYSKFNGELYKGAFSTGKHVKVK